MTVICVDDERQTAEQVAALCLACPGVGECVAFSRPADALDWLRAHRADVAVLDIRMPGMNGLELAAAIRRERPRTAIVFLTASPEHALKAFELHASGYLLKPVDRERLEAELAYAASAKRNGPQSRVAARTFGRFALFADGRELRFRQEKCRELLAYLVDRRGGSVTRAEAFAILWEDRLYDRSMQKQMDAIIRSLRATLREYGIDTVFEMKRGTMRIRPEELDCDLYRFLAGDADAIGEYRGEYMSGYAWAEMTADYMAKRAEDG